MGSIDYRLEPEKEHSLMDSNTAYHFSRLLQTTPYLGHCSRVVKMERYRVCAAGRGAEWREKFPRFRETRIVTRHRATRPVLITFRLKFYPHAPLRETYFFLLLLFFIIISLEGKAFHDSANFSSSRKEIDRRKLYPRLSSPLLCCSTSQ